MTVPLCTPEWHRRIRAPGLRDKELVELRTDGWLGLRAQCRRCGEQLRWPAPEAEVRALRCPDIEHERMRRNWEAHVRPVSIDRYNGELKELGECRKCGANLSRSLEETAPTTAAKRGRKR